jgi:hypothetical protein
MPTVDGHDWTAKRLRFLQQLLDDNPSDEQRAAVEAEMNELRGSRRGWRRWLGFPRLPHQH